MSLYNPLDKFYKSVTGAVRSGEEITFRVKGNFDSVVFVYEKIDGGGEVRVQMQKKEFGFECKTVFSRGQYSYRFYIGGGLFIGAGKRLCGIISDNPEKYLISAFSEDYVIPEWFKGGVLYQIFPDRFNRSRSDIEVPKSKVFHENTDDDPVFSPDEEGKVLNNDFFGGNIKGIIQKLPYLYSLGVTAIYLNPIFEAYSNHRYDTGDYFKIDSLLGAREDLVSLIKESDKLGIKIILDGVFNHTGDDSLYFDKYGRYGNHGAYGDPCSHYRDWYKFINYPKEYESWWGITTLPATNKENKDYINFITGDKGVISYYTALGIGGWRLDVVDELPAAFVREIRKAVKRSDKNAIVIGEVWEDASTKISYGVRREYFLGNELDSVMNYPLKDAIISFVKYGDSGTISDCLRTLRDRYPKAVLDSTMNMLGTHDTARILSVFGDFDYSGKTKEELARVKFSGEIFEKAKNRLKIAATLLYTLPGVPTVYYGDEAGMQGFSDPLNRRFFPWGKEDKDLFEFYVFLGELRKNNSLFKDGDFEELFAEDGGFAYKRCKDDKEILVAANCGEKTKYLRFSGNLTNLFTGEVFAGEIALKNGDYGIYADL